ncbi:uncharacterized protein [Blastocystis hominis]|uniref:DNA replication licensing factor MCM2 n=1 Tax=Blastocystis hominis TaxID=12968 RepID=D8M4K5_BLAHO|nr:uncharacterized protein [Blastocystis hominis]CBK22994.2 unnamed protein product [Blastocystis hominis]|eukprot:XP_012897042.1 uncharacterized protein [Blastocystis hominis]
MRVSPVILTNHQKWTSKKKTRQERQQPEVVWKEPQRSVQPFRKWIPPWSMKRSWAIRRAKRSSTCTLFNFLLSSFVQFLHNFTRSDEEGGNGENVYMEAIRSMCNNNEQSFEVFYSDLAMFDEFTSRVTEFLTEHPDIVLDMLNEGAKRVVLSEFPSYEEVHKDIYVRFRDFAVLESLRDLRSSSLGKLIRTQGVVTRRTSVFPQMLYVAFRCSFCNQIMEGIKQLPDREVKPDMCVFCQRKGGLQLCTENTVFRNYQKITLQESPGSVEAGRIPRSKEVILTADLIDVARPGDEVDVVGLYTNNFDMSLNTTKGFPVFSTVIEANNVSLLKDVMGSSALSHEDEQAIRGLAADPLFERRLLSSIAPSLFGHTDVKMAIAMALFGGQFRSIGALKGREKVEAKHRIRGDINVLLLGDPGTAKSQFLKYAERTSPRAVYTTGKGASAVGLTAAVHRDPLTKEWTLEGGALVLADRGVCLIDEFDKMNDADRVSIHEAMEQQSISISKAGIVTTLQARCAVLAAANPRTGRYDATRTFAENVDLTDPILQRFDILCVLQDQIDPVEDERLARFVVRSHVACHPRNMEKRMEEEAKADLEETAIDDPSIKLIPQSLLKKYIQYARTNIHPLIDNVDQDKIANIYAEIRRESVGAGGIPVAVRHIESIIRMAEAHARMHLREHVLDSDVDVAISTLLESFINSQKHSVKTALRRTFRKYLVRPEDSFALIMYQLKELVREQLEADAILENQSMEDDVVFRVPLKVLEESVRNVGVDNLFPFLESTMFKENRFTYDPQTQTIVRVFSHAAE